jgi:hypothetical protein
MKRVALHCFFSILDIECLLAIIEVYPITGHEAPEGD